MTLAMCQRYVFSIFLHELHNIKLEAGEDYNVSKLQIE
jgi:hypothetical protein